MYKWVRETINKGLIKIGRLVTFFIVLAIMLSVTGIAYAVVGGIEDPVVISNTTNYLIPGAVAVQMLLFAAWVGKTMVNQKYMSEALGTLGGKHDVLHESIGDIDKSLGSVETTVKDHGRRIIRLEDKL